MSNWLHDLSTFMFPAARCCKRLGGDSSRQAHWESEVATGRPKRIWCRNRGTNLPNGHCCPPRARRRAAVVVPTPVVVLSGATKVKRAEPDNLIVPEKLPPGSSVAILGAPVGSFGGEDCDEKWLNDNLADHGRPLILRLRTRAGVGES
jgi:hypothetical protein